MTKESIILKLKQTFTIKRILISLISLFFILFFKVGVRQYLLTKLYCLVLFMQKRQTNTL